MARKTFRLEIELESDSMVTEPTSVMDALTELVDEKAEWLNVEGESGIVRDPNGNAVGKWAVREGETEFTVIGLWLDDEPVIAGVVPGRHDVSGGDDLDEDRQPWAVCVTGATLEEIEAAASAEIRGVQD